MGVGWAYQTSIQRAEEVIESLGRIVRLLVSITQPLKSRDTDDSIKCSRPESKALTHVPQKQVPLHLSLPGHRCTDSVYTIRANPNCSPSILWLMSSPVQ